MGTFRCCHCCHGGTPRIIHFIHFLLGFYGIVQFFVGILVRIFQLVVRIFCADVPFATIHFEEKNVNHPLHFVGNFHELNQLLKHPLWFGIVHEINHPAVEVPPFSTPIYGNHQLGEWPARIGEITEITEMMTRESRIWKRCLATAGMFHVNLGNEQNKQLFGSEYRTRNLIRAGWAIDNQWGYTCGTILWIQTMIATISRFQSCFCFTLLEDFPNARCSLGFSAPRFATSWWMARGRGPALRCGIFHRW